MKYLRSVVANINTGIKAHWYSLTPQVALLLFPDRVSKLMRNLSNGVPNASESSRSGDQIYIETPNNDYIKWKENGRNVEELSFYIVTYTK